MPRPSRGLAHACDERIGPLDEQNLPGWISMKDWDWDFGRDFGMAKEKL